MRKFIISLVFFIILAGILITGCNKDLTQDKTSPEDIALKEAEKIEVEKGIL